MWNIKKYIQDYKTKYKRLYIMSKYERLRLKIKVETKIEIKIKPTIKVYERVWVEK